LKTKTKIWLSLKLKCLKVYKPGLWVEECLCVCVQGQPIKVQKFTSLTANNFGCFGPTQIKKR